MRVVIVLPGYNCETTLRKTFLSIPVQYMNDVIYVDDCSSDSSVQVAESLQIKNIFTHNTNLGYGGNQKTMYDKALEQGAEIVIMLHPDYQYDPKLIPEIVSKIEQGADVVFASRMQKGREAISLGMPWYKYWANRFLTLVQNLMFKQHLSEYHTGYRAYKADVLKSIDYHSLSNDFIFDNQIVLEIIKRKFQIKEIYCPAKYEEDSSSINFLRSIRYGTLVLWYSLVYKIKQ